MNGRGINSTECGSLGQSNVGVEAAAQEVGAEGLEGGEQGKMAMELGRVRCEKMAASHHPEMWSVSVITATVGKSDGFLKLGSFQKMVGKIFRGKNQNSGQHSATYLFRAELHNSCSYNTVLQI